MTRGSAAATWAYTLFGLAMAAAAVTVAGLLWGGLSIATAINSFALTNLAIGVSFAPCGLIVARRRPDNPIGWLMLVASLSPLTGAAMVAAGEYGAAHGWSAGALRATVTVFFAAWPWGIGLVLPLVLQLLPTGRPLPGWRPVLWTSVLVGALFSLWSATDGTAFIEVGDQTFATGLARPRYPQVEALAAAIIWPLHSAVLLVSVVSLVVRHVRGDETVRRQLLWLVLAVVAVGVVTVPAGTVPRGGTILVILAVPLIPLAIAVSIVRYQLFDIRLVVSRTVLYALLTVAVVGGYAVLVAVLDRLLRGYGAPVLATLLIALAFNPVRVRLQRLVDRAFYGSRRDPVRAVSEVGEHLDDEDPAEVLMTIREVLRLPFVALRAANRELGASGAPPAVLHTVPLSYDGARIGELVVGLRTGERRLAAADAAVLDLLAKPLAVALHATALSEELQRSRERIVTAAEDERRRIHRELHDSLGPALTGAAFKVQATGNLITTDPARAEVLNGELGGQIRDAIDDVRRLVYGLRPPALDELGLVGALRRYAGGLPGLSLSVETDGAQPLPVLTAAVEVAAYRIATEALTNVARHSGATSARVALEADGATLRLTVADDGVHRGQWRPGTGLKSMVERATELGGSCEAGATPTGGRVEAMLPLGGAT